MGFETIYTGASGNCHKNKLKCKYCGKVTVIISGGSGNPKDRAKKIYMDIPSLYTYDDILTIHKQQNSIEECDSGGVVLETGE
jgi:hypothetical protein